MVLAIIFCFASLKVNDTKNRMLTDTFEFSTPKLLRKTLFSHLKIYMPCTNLNTTQFQEYTYMAIIWVQKTLVKYRYANNNVYSSRSL